MMMRVRVMAMVMVMVIVTVTVTVTVMVMVFCSDALGEVTVGAASRQPHHAPASQHARRPAPSPRSP